MYQIYYAQSKLWNYITKCFILKGVETLNSVNHLSLLGAGGDWERMKKEIILSPYPKTPTLIEDTWNGVNLKFRNCFILTNQETSDQEVVHLFGSLALPRVGAQFFAGRRCSCSGI